jgi:exonuclease SbcC
MVTEEQLKKARTDYDNTEKKYRQATEVRQEKEREQAEILAEGKSLREQLGELASLTAEEMQVRVKSASADFDKAQKAEQESATIQKTLATLASELTILETQIKTQEGKENELKTAQAVQENLIRALIKDIPKEVNNEVELRDRIAKLGDEKETAQDLLHKHQQELQTEIAKMEKAKHTIEEDEKHLNGDRLAKRKGILDTIKDLEKSIEKNLAKYGFVETKEVLEAILKEDDKVNFKQKTDKYLAEKNKLQALFDEKKKKIGVRAKPDLTSLQAEVGKLESDYMDMNRQLTQTKTEKEKILLQRNEITKQKTELDELNEMYEGLPELVNVAKGNNELRQKFEIFVLSVFLDEVLYYANQRLDLLSNGRYQLERSEDVVDGRKGAGMDLIVFDQYTGTTRPVENLSGGETFFTSLALALGLADTAVAQAGGRSLDAMFIDEGFGTLDSETLDLAIKTLHNLSDEQRLVGIISHVAELKERIPTKLEVRKMKNGSVVRVN